MLHRGVVAYCTIGVVLHSAPFSYLPHALHSVFVYTLALWIFCWGFVAVVVGDIS